MNEAEECWDGRGVMTKKIALFVLSPVAGHNRSRRTADDYLQLRESSINAPFILLLQLPKNSHSKEIIKISQRPGTNALSVCRCKDALDAWVS